MVTMQNAAKNWEVMANVTDAANVAVVVALIMNYGLLDENVLM